MHFSVCPFVSLCRYRLQNSPDGSTGVYLNGVVGWGGRGGAMLLVYLGLYMSSYCLTILFLSSFFLFVVVVVLLVCLCSFCCCCYFFGVGGSFQLS